MTLQELVNAVILKATGKATILSPGDTKYQKILGIANGYIDSWQNEYGVDWSSLYQKDFEVGTVGETDTYDLDDDIRKISDTKGDYVYIVKGADKTPYTLVAASTLKRYSPQARVCAQIGRTLVFPKAFESDDPEIGATILVPCFLYADLLANANDEVAVDIPRWLVIMTAAEYVRNDVTKQNQYPNLVQEASALMDRMIDDNDGQINTVYQPWRPMGRSW